MKISPLSPLVPLVVMGAFLAQSGQPAAAAAVQDAGEEAAADAYWKEHVDLEGFARPFGGITYFEAEKKWGSYSADFWLWWNELLQDYRDQGVEFWGRFPADPRRYEWLLGTVSWPPQYWKDKAQGARASANRTPELVLIDEEAQAAWGRKYLIMRAQFMAAPEVTEQQRALLRFRELSSRAESVGQALKRGEKTDELSHLVAQVLDLVSTSTPETLPADYVTGVAGALLGAMNGDSTITMEAACLAAMRVSPRVEMRLFAAGREQVMKMRTAPLDLLLPTMTGGQVDLAKLRGKVVLVDIWSNDCVSCIEAMPKVQAVYEKYRDRGFEVIGVWSARNEAKHKPRGLEILKQQGVTYTNAMVTGREAFEDFAEKYSIIGVPVTWLLDQNGLLVTNDISGSTKLESEVRKLLGLPPLKAGEAAKPAQKGRAGLQQSG